MWDVQSKRHWKFLSPGRNATSSVTCLQVSSRNLPSLWPRPVKWVAMAGMQSTGSTKHRAVPLASPCPHSSHQPGCGSLAAALHVCNLP